MPRVGFEPTIPVFERSKAFQRHRSKWQMFTPLPKKTHPPVYPPAQQFLHPPARPHTLAIAAYSPKWFTYEDESRDCYCKCRLRVYCTWSIRELIPAVHEMEDRQGSRRCRLRYQWPRVIPEVVVRTCGQMNVIALSRTKSKTKKIGLLTATVADKRKAACEVRIVFRTGLV
jgi:hypothetical protein